MRNLAPNAQILFMVMIFVNGLQSWSVLSGFAQINRNEGKMFEQVYPLRLRILEQVESLRQEMRAQFDELKHQYPPEARTRDHEAEK